MCAGEACRGMGEGCVRGEQEGEGEGLGRSNGGGLALGNNPSGRASLSWAVQQRGKSLGARQACAGSEIPVPHKPRKLTWESRPLYAFSSVKDK